jgi:hypothetical protein
MFGVSTVIHKYAALTAALLLSVALAAPARAADGQLTFRLTLRGNVPSTDAFALLTNSPELSTGSERGFFCGPPVLGFIYNEDPPPCAAGDYEIAFTLPIGLTTDYSFVRYSHFQGESDEQPSRLFEGGVTVSDSPQVRYFVYDYSLGSSPGTLPDAAMTDASADRPPARVIGTLLLVVGMLSALRRRVAAGDAPH